MVASREMPSAQGDEIPLCEGEGLFFHSPTWGRMSWHEVMSRIDAASAAMHCDPTIAVGSDSQSFDDGVRFVCAVTAHFPGKGGIYFYRIERAAPMALAQRIFREASMSLEMAEMLRLRMSEMKSMRISASRVRWEIHLDMGGDRRTRDMLPSVVGMIKGSGYTCRTKPDAYGATKVADRHSK